MNSPRRMSRAAGDGRRSSARRSKCAAFTLIELLVAIGVVTILVSILIPAVSGVKRRAREAATRSLIRDIGIALDQYGSDQNAFPPDGNNSMWGYLSGSGYRTFTTKEVTRLSGTTTATAGDKTTVTDANQTWPSGLVGDFVRITSGNASGDLRIIATVAAPDVTVTADFTDTIASNTTYEIAEIVDAFGRKLFYDEIEESGADPWGDESGSAPGGDPDPRGATPSAMNQDYDIWSLGYDGRTGGSDDLGNWD